MAPLVVRRLWTVEIPVQVCLVVPAALSVAYLTACSAVGESGAPLDASARWEERAPAPERRTEVSVATDGARIYLLGGFLALPDDHPEGETPPASRALLVYDPATDRWSEAGDVPVGTNHAGLVAVDGRLYLVGGYRDNSFEPRSGEVWIYDPATGEWSEGSPMPTPRGALAYAVLDGKIHA
ncbi:MAG: Kelch repeat-containing protein, partial [Gemmatimonadota bacterium]